MNKTIKILGFIALVAIIGLTMASCASKSKGKAAAGVPLVAPQDVKAVQSAVTPPWRSITVSWSAVEGADRYGVYQISADGSSTRSDVKGTSNVFNHHFPGREFSYEVVALKGKKGVGPKSERVTVRTTPETQADITARAEAAAKAEADRLAKAAAAEAAAKAEAERVAAIENTPQFQQLRGNWRMEDRGKTESFTFPQRLNESFFDSKNGTKPGKITGFTNNSVRAEFAGGRFGIVTFNYAISGNRVTITNWTHGGFAMNDMNGVYIKER